MSKDIIVDDNVQKSSRRDFLKKSVVGAGTLAVAGVGLSGLTSCGGSAPITDKSLPEKWDGDYDVIVVGSGFAGLAAAIEAKRTGSSVLLLEKMSTFGGNSAINGGYLAVPGSDLQKKEGVKDSVDLYVNDMLKAGHGLNHVDLARTIAKDVKSAYEFTVECGAEYKPKLSHLGGHSVPRTYYTKNSSGSGIVKPLLATAKKEGVVLKKKAKLETLYKSDSGRVVGVSARMNFQFGKDDSGKVRKFKANKAVIIASGGFSQDQAYRSAQDPRLTGNVDSTNQPGATAAALAEVFRVGGVPVHVSRIQLGPWACPDEKGFGVGSPFNIDAGLRFGIMVERKTGKRFVNELADRKTRADAMLLNVDSKGKPDYPIIFTDSVGASSATTLDRALESKVVKKFNSLKELAKFHKLP